MDKKQIAMALDEAYKHEFSVLFHNLFLAQISKENEALDDFDRGMKLLDTCYQEVRKIYNI